MDREIIDYIRGILKNKATDVNFHQIHGDEFTEKVRNILTVILTSMGKSLAPDDFKRLYKVALNEYLHENPIHVELSQSLTKNRKHWLTEERKKKAGWSDSDKPLGSYRTRYLQYLRKIGRAETVVDDVAKSSLSILEKIEDPLVLHKFQKKGLVVGSVQSGKTGNFNAVINSSIDLGYRLIIVLSGGMEDLRRQTQDRIQKEVEGRQIKEGEWTGVGKIAKFGIGHYNIEQIVIPTAIDKDFNMNLSQADFALDRINVLVCKKNTSILRNILVWLKKFATDETISSIPLLVIDDEADNASLNNMGHKGKNLATKINLQIRCILNLFAKSSYIGYTATPFANILQDRNEEPDAAHRETVKQDDYIFHPIGNLFPEDFIELLNPPSNYIGPKNFFETKISDTQKIPSLINVVNDWYSEFPYRVWKDNPSEAYSIDFDLLRNELGSEAAVRKQIREQSRGATRLDNFPKALPDSLKDAVKCFIVSCAVRLKRKPLMKESVLFQKHNSMLIHISRFTFWQDRTTVLLEKFFDDLKKDLNNEPVNSPVYDDFRRIWNKYYLEDVENGLIKDYLPKDYKDEFMQPTDFDEVLKYLISAVNAIEIVCANTNSKMNLDYSKDAKSYIVVGGNRLSRGFTLEGLTINYFVRDTNYADSLLQMGRWFGYRPGYLDCCKLFTTADTVESFDFSTSVIEDVEAQFSKMASKDKTPADFAIKVMNDPDVIKITRPSILKNAQTVRWSYSDKLDQTTKFALEKERIEAAWENFKNYFAKKELVDYKSSIKYYETDADEVCEILKMPNTFLNPQHFDPLIAFVKDVKDRGILSRWSVAIRYSGQGEPLENTEEIFNFEITPAVRRINSANHNRISEVVNGGIFTASGNSSNIITAGSDFAFALSAEEKDDAEKTFREEKNTTNYPEKIYRNRLYKNHGVLIIYPIDLKVLEENTEIKTYLEDKNISSKMPLLGFAVGIPDLGDGFEKEYFVQKGFLDEHGNILDEYILDEGNEEAEDEKYEDELIEVNNE